MTPNTEKPEIEERLRAWRDAKLAVGRYAREPSEVNAGRVANAWSRVRGVMARAIDERIDRELAELRRRSS